MKLYYSPHACSLAPHIILNECGEKFDLVKVNLQSKQSADGDYAKLNPKGYVPALLLPNGELLTEGAVILQWLADQKPNLQLLPPVGTMARYRTLEWLNFIATELHKGIGILWSPIIDDANKAKLVENLAGRFELVNSHLAKNKFVMGESFSICDAYLFTVMRWPLFLKIDLSKYEAITKFMADMENRASVKKALAAEQA